jgi:hypothetical protein
MLLSIILWPYLAIVTMADELSELGEHLKTYRAGSLDQQATAYAGLALVATIRRFERNAKWLTRALIALTVILVVLTAILVVIELHR